MSARQQTRWEIDRCRQLLALSADELDESQEFSIRQEFSLRNALTYAVRAWCRTHLRCNDARLDNDSYFGAFKEKAPDDMVKAVNRAGAALDRPRSGPRRISTEEVVASVGVAVEAALGAASRPPRNRRSFPGHLRTGQAPRKPRLRPGSWIDTGRYRPAVVLEIMSDPPHTMKLSYGDEIDEDFRPHITNWTAIRRPERIDSLKEVFSSGDWFRHPWSGYGRVLEVRDSTMEVEYQGRRATVVPDAALQRFQKVEGPEPEDIRPLAERFPPGTWIEQDHFGRGVVLGSDEGSIESINVLFPSRVVRTGEGAAGKGPVIWKLDRNPLDFSKSWGRRWAFWRQYNAISRRPVCVCCGYPNFGGHTRETAAPRVCIICGYPEFGLGIFEKENNVCVCRVGTRWWHRHMWEIPEVCEVAFEVMGKPDTAAPTDDDLKTSGYSLSEARRNFESRGVMFRPDTHSALTTDVATALRRSLVRLLEKATAEPPQWNHDDRRKAEKIRKRILAELAKAKDCP